MVNHVTPGGSTPVPDPTKLTQEAVDRSTATLKELFDVRIIALEKTAERLQKTVDERPATVVNEIGHLQKLTEEKFKGVADNFAGRDTALAAALLASALSAAKSEAATTKLIDGISDTITAMAKNFDDKIEAIKALITAGTKATDDKVDDLRARVGAVENQKKGVADNWGAISMAVSLAVGLIVIVGFVITLSAREAQPIVIERPAATTGAPL